MSSLQSRRSYSEKQDFVTPDFRSGLLPDYVNDISMPKHDFPSYSCLAPAWMPPLAAHSFKFGNCLHHFSEIPTILLPPWWKEDSVL